MVPLQLVKSRWEIAPTIMYCVNIAIYHAAPRLNTSVGIYRTFGEETHFPPTSTDRKYIRSWISTPPPIIPGLITRKPKKGVLVVRKSINLFWILDVLDYAVITVDTTFNMSRSGLQMLHTTTANPFKT